MNSKLIERSQKEEASTLIKNIQTLFKIHIARLLINCNPKMVLRCGITECPVLAENRR